MRARDRRGNVRWAVLAVFAAAAALGACRRTPAAGASPAPAGGGADALGVPSGAELDAYVTGAGGVHLGMTESEVSDALDAKPSRRQEFQRGVPQDIVWESIGGAHPGAAVAFFIDDRLQRIEFAPSPRPELPRVDRAAVDALTTGEIARRSYERTLLLSDVEAVTGAPGYRASWTIGRGMTGTTSVRSKWIWEVEPGKVLYVDEERGYAGQPVVRSLK